MNLDDLSHILESINYFCCFFIAILSIFQLVVKNKKWTHYLLFIIYFSYSAILFEVYFYQAGLVLKNINFLAFSYCFHFWIISGFYLYVKLILNPGFKIRKRDLLHFLPGLLCLISLIPLVYTKNAAEKLGIFNLKNSDPFHFLNIFIYIFTLFKIVYGFLALYNSIILWRIRRIIKRKEFVIIYIFCYLVLFIILFSLMAFLLNNRTFIGFLGILFSSILIAGSFAGYRYPNILNLLSDEIKKEKYIQSRLKGIKVSKIVEKLSELFETEKIFRDPELSIKTLGSMLKVSGHQLSEIMNKNLNTNFRTYINCYRIDEACLLLLEKPEESILNIAYEVGFNSKTPFNTFFVKRKGMVPSEFRKRNLCTMSNP